MRLKKKKRAINPLPNKLTVKVIMNPSKGKKKMYVNIYERRNLIV